MVDILRKDNIEDTCVAYSLIACHVDKNVYFIAKLSKFDFGRQKKGVMKSIR